jgi:hypothetical protein
MIMTAKYLMVGILLLISCLILTSSAGAALPISTINPGNTVFVGEQGLDITAAMEGDSILGWWASGAAIASAAPDKTITVPDRASFSVYPGDFQTHTGNWYHMASLSKVNGTAFSVADPQIDLRIEDTTVSVDVTDKWLPTGDAVQFRIDTNLLQMTQRAGVPSVPVTIKVQNPDGAVMSQLVDSSGSVTSIVDYPVNSNPQYTGPIWSTGNRDTYPPGTYLVWVECNVNSMKDNYAQTGKTVSRQVSLLNQNQNPLINDRGYVTNPSTPVTTLVPKTTTASRTPVVTPVITTVPPTIPPSVSLPVQTPGVTGTAAVPIPTTAKTPGFEALCALAAVIAGIVLFLKKE